MFFAFILIYLFGLLAAGAWFAKRIKDSKSFLVADRALPWYVSTGTIVATFMGAGSLIGAAGLAYRVGISALWMDIGGVLALVAIAALAGRIRKFEGLTTPEILGARFNEATRVVAALIIVAAETAITGYQIRAGGYVLNMVAGIGRDTGMLITAIFIIGYTVLAGMLSVAYTDLIQGITILIALFISLPFVVSAAGGMGNVAASLPVGRLSLTGGSFQEAMGVFFPTFCLVFVMQPIWQRVFSCKDDRESRKAVFISAPIVLAMVAVLAFVATVGAVTIPDLEDGGAIIIALATNALPPVVGVVTLCAAVAIIISTGDSMLLSAASNVMNDFYLRFVNPNASEKRIILLTRITIVVLGVLAFIQIRFFPNILAMVIYAYTMEGGLAPALLAAFYWRRASVAGGFVCVASAGITTVVWELLGQPFNIDTAFVTIGVSVTLLFTVSMLTPPPGEEHLKRFEMSPEERTA